MVEASRPANLAQPRRKTLVLENSVELRRAPEEVFDYLSDIRNEREWNSTMQAVEMVTPGPLRLGSARWRWRAARATLVESPASPVPAAGPGAIRP